MDLAKSADVPAELAAQYETNAGHYWHLFYNRNADRFFRDRHWFANEFPQLLTARIVLEVRPQLPRLRCIPLMSVTAALCKPCCGQCPASLARGLRP
jgi:hypothetical protein